MRCWDLGDWISLYKTDDHLPLHRRETTLLGLLLWIAAVAILACIWSSAIAWWARHSEGLSANGILNGNPKEAFYLSLIETGPRWVTALVYAFTLRFTASSERGQWLAILPIILIAWLWVVVYTFGVGCDISP